MHGRPMWSIGAVEGGVGRQPEVSSVIVSFTAPFIGSSVIAGLHLATGHYRNGIVLAPLTGAIVAALVTNAAPPVDLAPLSPVRVLVRA